MSKKSHEIKRRLKRNGPARFRKVMAEVLERRYAIGSMLIAVPGGGLLQSLLPAPTLDDTLDPLGAGLGEQRSSNRLEEPAEVGDQVNRAASERQASDTTAGSASRLRTRDPRHANWFSSVVESPTYTHSNFGGDGSSVSDPWAPLDILSGSDEFMDDAVSRFAALPLPSSNGSQSTPFVRGGYDGFALGSGASVSGYSGSASFGASTGSSQNAAPFTDVPSWSSVPEGEGDDGTTTPPADTTGADPTSGSVAANSPPASPADGSTPGQTRRIGPDPDTWSFQESGGTDDPGTVTYASDDATLREGDSFLVELSHDFEVPDEPLSLTFTYETSFDTSDPDFINDAFEAVLVQTFSCLE